MAQAARLAPELMQSLSRFATALVAAARNWTLYPPQHPTLRMSITRLEDAIRQAASGNAFSIGITPDTLMIEGAAADPSQAGIREAAGFLHDRDLVAMTFTGDVPPDAIQALLRLLSLDESERRSRGGPASIWRADGHPSVVLEQIDYSRVLAREQGTAAEPARRDDLWQSIVRSIVQGQKPAFDERAQARLLAIAGSPVDIVDLTTAVAAPKHAVDGSPMITSQAAAVLAAFRQLTGIVSVIAPERLPEVTNNLANAAVQLDAHVLMQVLQSEDDAKDGVSVVRGLTAAFDDAKVAQLLATALALEGKATDRLATVFNTIAPDPDRKRRVLTMTRHMLKESDFGRTGQFQTLWTSMEELLVSYDERPFVSDAYRAALDEVGVRAERMAAVDLPPELPEWIDTLGQQNVRSLSVIMLADLLNLEQDQQRARQVAEDMETLAEDLLMAGAYDDALAVTKALADRASARAASGREACRLALDQLGASAAMREAAAFAGDVDAAGWQSIQAIVDAVGVAAVEALKPVVMSETDDPTTGRVEDLIVRFGNPVVVRLGSLVGDSRWFVQRRAARLLGRIGTAEAVPLLQPLLRGTDPRVAREAISALAAIPDPAAARAVHTVLRASSGEVRRAIVDTLVEVRDPRVVPLLIRILEDSQPLGKDHAVALDTIRALGRVGSDQAVPALVAIARQRAWFGRRKLRALKALSIEALMQVGGSRADRAIRDASQTGDSMLRKIVAARDRSSGLA